MEHEDKIIKSYLEGTLNDKKPCLESERLADYIAGNLSKNALADIEEHIASCKECLDKISMSTKADTLWKNGQLASASQAAISKAKDIAVKKPKGPKGKFWFLATIIAFVTSFIFPRYFIQCLVATILLGLKWIVESENVRTLILVLDSWRKHHHDRDDEISQRLKERGKNINGGSWYQPSKKD